MNTTSISTETMKNLLTNAVNGALAVVLLLLLGIALPMNRGDVRFAVQSTADTSQEYVAQADSGDAVPVNAGRFQLKRILQQLQLRLGSSFRPFTPREIIGSIGLHYDTLLAGLILGCCLRGFMRTKHLFHLYLNAITPCRAGPAACVL